MLKFFLTKFGSQQIQYKNITITNILNLNTAVTVAQRDYSYSPQGSGSQSGGQACTEDTKLRRRRRMRAGVRVGFRFQNHCHRTKSVILHHMKQSLMCPSPRTDFGLFIYVQNPLFTFSHWHTLTTGGNSVPASPLSL